MITVKIPYPVTPEEQKIYKEGWDSYLRVGKDEYCPYPFLSRNYDLWNYGSEAAEDWKLQQKDDENGRTPD